MKRIYNALSWLVVSVMVCTFIYGFIRFPDSPIHPCAAHEYCGKQGQPHTLNDYLAFDRWETFIFYLWPIGILSLFLLRAQTDKLSSANSASKGAIGPKDYQPDVVNISSVHHARTSQRMLQWLLIFGGPLGFVLVYIPLMAHFTSLQSDLLRRSVMALAILPGTYGVTLVTKNSSSQLIVVAMYIFASLMFIITCLQIYACHVLKICS
jgi:hypothetical protein